MLSVLAGCSGTALRRLRLGTGQSWEGRGWTFKILPRLGVGIMFMNEAGDPEKAVIWIGR